MPLRQRRVQSRIEKIIEKKAARFKHPERSTLLSSRDLAQDAWFRLLDAGFKVNPPEQAEINPRTYGTIRNAMRQRIRNESRLKRMPRSPIQSIEELSESHHPMDSTPLRERQMERVQQWKALRRAMRTQLTPIERKYILDRLKGIDSSTAYRKASNDPTLSKELIRSRVGHMMREVRQKLRHFEPQARKKTK